MGEATVRYVGRGNGWPCYITDPPTGLHYATRRAAEAALHAMGIVGIRFVDENRYDLETDVWLEQRNVERDA